MEKYGVIMAGGGGTRFWPLSREKTPKQLLNLTGNGLMINETIERMSDVIENGNIFIVSNKQQIELMEKSVSNAINKQHILSEPDRRNTAACIGYAAMEIIKKYGDGIMCIFPSDHYIKDKEEFSHSLELAIDEAEQNNTLVTIGIKPTFPSTGYGYIKYNKKNTEASKNVMEFVEKPNLKKAKEYIDDGEYVWNSGIFVWKASVILDNYRRFLPRVYKYLVEIGESMNTPEEYDVIQEIYPQIPDISIDYGVMERSDDVKVIIGDFGWNDIGSWDTLAVLYNVDENGNVIKGDQVNIDTSNCISYSENRLIATVGVDNLIIVETKDAILVCHKDKAQDVKKVVDQLKNSGKNGYL